MEDIRWYNKAKLSFAHDEEELEIDVIGGDIVVHHTPSGREEIQLRSGNFIPSDKAILLVANTECTLVYPVGAEEKTLRFKIIDWVDGTKQAAHGILSGFLLIQII